MQQGVPAGFASRSNNNRMTPSHHRSVSNDFNGLA
jgi:hypothetical protein